MFELRSWQARLGFGCLLLLIAFFLFFPVYWALISAFKGNSELYQLNPTLFPGEIHFGHFITALTEGNLLLQLKNSLLTSTSSALLNAALASLAGYSFAKFEYPGKKSLMLLILSAQMFPFGVLLISIYPMLQTADLLDTKLGLTISYIVFALPVSTYMMYSYFKQLPNELIEAAKVDGASNFRIFYRIVLPISFPAFITVTLYAFMWSWNDLLYSMTLITSETNRTVGPGLLLQYINENNADWGGAMAASFIAASPVILVFALLQKQFIGGVTSGAVK
ncbi:carbohydrate ABC transporter permease [Parendozoicomonas haliclonae]|uniref:Inner membrane ABC transporter permease protein YcjP n=1 Tax=Parendozoicomonas haliclonae TaxID=1960125 RepID=A0A1X7AR67_9GAMM|nr:carbohydrate ABC transporter permease [Parendozoicomonas haliclonae]SMA50725.1 Inner membrane ABC transporter permease protein YcjP [Parendozoicomonas haliclonae]